MSEPTMPSRRFHAEEGVEDWRVLFSGPHARYACGDLRAAAAFAAAVAEEVEGTGVRADVDLRPGSVTVRLPFDAVDRISIAQLAVAQAIQRAATGLGLEATPDRLRLVQLAVAQSSAADTRAFWRAALGYDAFSDEDAVDPDRRDVPLWFHPIRDDRPGRGRTHVDVSVPADQAPLRVAAALEAGGRLVDDSRAPAWWTLASPDGHGVDIAGWADDNDD